MVVATGMLASNWDVVPVVIINRAETMPVTRMVIRGTEATSEKVLPQ